VRQAGGGHQRRRDPAPRRHLDQALANDVEGMERLTGEQARALEPGLNAHAALLSPESGVFDSHGYMLALQGEIEAAGGAVVLSTPFEGAEALPGGGFITCGPAGGADDLTCRLLVTAPGLSAQDVAAGSRAIRPTASPRATSARASISA
jgi:L-2-hydroxyglutarate oxidase LhgO